MTEKFNLLVSLPAFSSPISATIHLPSSKSESARTLIINYLEPKFIPHNLSEANDTMVLNAMLNSKDGFISAEDAGTAMRLGLAALAISNKKCELTGTSRMCERPIAPLVEALRTLGASIKYKGVEGYPPLLLHGFEYSGISTLSVKANISSQYLTALMLVAPALPNGLTIIPEGKLASLPYLELTAQIMNEAGVQVSLSQELIQIPKTSYQPAQYDCGGDWSAASYAYASLVLMPVGSSITLPHLKMDSTQGDKACASLFKHFGIATHPFATGVQIIKEHSNYPVSLSIDFSQIPDLAQTMVAIAAAVNCQLHATGLHSLYIKESNRVQALITELSKLGAVVNETAQGEMQVVSGVTLWYKPIQIDTWDDHRMAMSITPLATLGPLVINDAGVVKKSFPSFWQQLKELGFNVAQSV